MVSIDSHLKTIERKLKALSDVLVSGLNEIFHAGVPYAADKLVI